MGGRNNSRGFTLIAALLILVLLSGVAAGLMYMVTNETKMGGNDLEANLAYYGAESGMEKLTANLAALYVQYQVPTGTQIQALATQPPTSAMVPGMNYPVGSMSITYPTTTAGGPPTSAYNTISSGANQGLYAEITPMTLQVTASRPGGAQVNITRSVEIALIPVFQFGVFCGYDCSYFAGPNFSFAGRIHTNQNLFLASGADLVFNNQVSAYSQVILDQLENGHPTSSGYGGTVYVPKATSGCAIGVFPPTGANCVALPSSVPGDASWSGGYPGVGGSANSGFASISTGTLNGFLTNSTTGAKNMQLPFVQNSCTSNPPPCTDPIAIVRKPVAGEAASSTIGTSRLYNKAQIRILISDDPADLHPERGTAPIDGQDVQFPNTTTFNSPSNTPFQSGAVTLTSGPTEYIGWATAGTGGWAQPYTDAGVTAWATYPLVGETTNNPSTVAGMTGPWIRVEYQDATGNWHGVTQEWLKLGFSRFFNLPPTSPGSNVVDANAILILQQLRPTLAPAAAHGAGTQGNFWPINFYDSREGEMRDTAVANVSTTLAAAPHDGVQYSSCSVNGIMTAVELDVGNLKNWLNGTVAGSGTSVNYSSQNGYVLYFSDHRGMRKDPNIGTGTTYSGESGIEDVINSSANLTSTATDGSLEARNYYTYSPEDVDQNGILDNWGEKNIGYGFGINTNTSPLNPFPRIAVAHQGATNSVDCFGYDTTTGALLTGATDNMGMANPASGARHVLKLVDGGMNSGTLQSYLPVQPAASGCTQTAANATGCGGFTLASENPVYVQGNYNTTSADPFWTTATATPPTQTPHSAASIIADSVTLLSNQWGDMNSLNNPTTIGSRAPTTDAYYRTAISAGKNIPFPQPSWGAQDFGTDGGMHNFLRYLENMGGITVHYNGSLVSMYYSEYDTGTFKCCTVVYSAPATRSYFFDVMFLNPSNLPPATPEFQDIDNLSYHQNFTPQLTSAAPQL
jgi:hypothetical protein